MKVVEFVGLRRNIAVVVGSECNSPIKAVSKGLEVLKENKIKSLFFPAGVYGIKKTKDSPKKEVLYENNFITKRLYRLEVELKAIVKDRGVKKIGVSRLYKDKSLNRFCLVDEKNEMLMDNLTKDEVAYLKKKIQ